MSLANSSKKRKMVELPDIGLAIAIGGFIAYAIYRWSQEPGASVILGLITTLLTFLIKICIYFYRIRLITISWRKKSHKTPCDVRLINSTSASIWISADCVISAHSRNWHQRFANPESRRRYCEAGSPLWQSWLINVGLGRRLQTDEYVAIAVITRNNLTATPSRTGR